MNTKSRRRSFTLIELLIVIGIIIILAGIAIPNFYKAKERALTKEASVNLKLIAAAEKVYRMGNPFYYPNTGYQSAIADINSYLRLYFTDETNWDYTITVATDKAFTATAVRTVGTNPCTFTINQGTTGEPTYSGTCP